MVLPFNMVTHYVSEDFLGSQLSTQFLPFCTEPSFGIYKDYDNHSLNSSNNFCVNQAEGLLSLT